MSLMVKKARRESAYQKKKKEEKERKKMAKAEARCKCERCGREFVKIAYKQDREQARSFEAWAAENCTVCPDCYKEEKDRETEAFLASFGPAAELAGTPKQAEWAKKLRAKAVVLTWEFAEIHSKRIDKEKVREFLGWILANKEDARFWIDNRAKDGPFLLQDKELAEEFTKAAAKSG